VPGTGPDDCRDLDFVSLVERTNAVVHVVQEQFGLPREALEREAARVLGTSRMTSRARELIGEAVDNALANGRVQQDAEQVTMPA
jgi:hypothetical protein